MVLALSGLSIAVPAGMGTAIGVGAAVGVVGSAVWNVGFNSDSGGSGGSGGGGGSSGRPNSGVKAKTLSDIPCSSGCEDVAQAIQQRIGGEIWEADPPAGTNSVAQYRDQDSFWGHHEFVVKDGYAYDEWTGEMGEPLQQYKEQFQYWT